MEDINYIQDTDWWKEIEERVGREMAEECREKIDKTVIDCLDVPKKKIWT